MKRLNLAGLLLFAVSAVAGAACDRADLIIENARPFGGEPAATISIKGDRICAVGAAPAHGADVRTIDARGRTVLPGLIDAHVHLFPMGASAGLNSDAELERYVRDELPARLQTYLERGVTTLFSVGDAWPAVRDLRRQISNGELAGPRLFITGPILTAKGGYPAATICADSPWCRSRLTVELRDAEHARSTVRELAADGVDAIKLVYDQAGDDARAKKLDPSLIRAVAREAHALGLPVVAHATQVEDALEVAELGADVLAHLPSGGAIDAARAARLRQHTIAIISTAGVYAPVRGPDGAQRTAFGLRYGPPFDQLYAQGMANAGALIDAGIPLAFGSGTAMFTPARSLDGEIRALSEIPMTPQQLLDARTIDAARAIGREDSLGSIAAGKLADIVIVDTNPDDPSVENVRVVIKGGQIVVDRRSP